MLRISTRMRVLVIAEACNPEWTSVPLVGYNFARALASREDLDVVLATHPRNRKAVEADPLSKLATVIYPDNEYIARNVYNFAQWFRGGKGKGWTTNTGFAAMSYLFFERELYKLVRNELKSGDFDLIHRITPVSPTAASPLAKWTDVPMIIGPLNGGLPWPREYPQLRKKEREYLVPLRKIYKLFPYYRSTYKHAAAVIAGSQHTMTEIPGHFRGKKYLLPENGVDPTRFELADDWTPPAFDGRFRFVTVGRLVPYKGLWLTLQAMRDSRTLKECELVVIGDGPDRPLIEKMVQDYGLTDQVRLLGWLDQREMARELASSQCFVFPSLREFGGGVVLEAMASGLPSIIVNYGGPTDLINNDCGILLPMQPEQPLVSSIREAMETLVDHPQRCREFALNAVQRIREEFTWSAKAEKLSQIYHEVLGVEPCQTRPNQELVTSALTS